MEDKDARYRPTSDRPWRVVWGFGAFEDFATPDEAQEKFATIPKEMLPMEPFNAVDYWAHRA